MSKKERIKAKEIDFLNTFIRNSINNPNSTENNIKFIHSYIASLSKKTNISFNEILSLLSKQQEQELLIPTSIFQNKKLGIIESLVKFLKQEYSLKFSEIAILLKRDQRAIRVSFIKAIKKDSSKIPKSGLNIPISIFTQADSPLTNLSKYLKNTGLKNSQIAFLLNKNPKAIWSAINK